MLDAFKEGFPFTKKDIVLAKYGSEVFYAKIVDVDYKKRLAKLLFDDGSKEKLSFDRICSVNETTSDIICVICKKDITDLDNDIVLCDECNVGFHQNCHDPIISSDVLKPEVSWECSYCSQKIKNPHVQSNPFEVKNSSHQVFKVKEKSGFEENVKEFTQTCLPKEFTVEIEKLDTKVIDVSTKCIVVENKQRPENDMIDKADIENPGSISLDESNSQNQEISSKSEDSGKTVSEFGEQVVIAHADSTSKEDDDEDIIIDVENDNDIQTIQATEASDDRLKGEGLLKIYDEHHKLLSRTAYIGVNNNLINPHNLRYQPYSKPTEADKSVTRTAIDTKALRNVALKRYLSNKYALCNKERGISVAALNPIPTERSQVQGSFEHMLRTTCSEKVSCYSTHLQNISSSKQIFDPLQRKMYSKEDIDKCLRNVPYSTNINVNREHNVYEGNVFIKSINNEPNIRCTDRKPRNFFGPVGQSNQVLYSSNIHSRNRLNERIGTSYFLPTKDMLFNNTTYATDQLPCQVKRQQKHEKINDLTMQTKQTCFKKVCPCCGKHANLLCSGCQNVRYCSKQCQVKDWRLHAYKCKIFHYVTQGQQK